MSLFSRFRTDERGNIALLFGLAVVPAVMAIGVAVDYARVSHARTEMQAAVDAAAVSAARAAVRMSEREFQTYAKAMFTGNLGNPNYAVDTFSAERGARVITASAEGKMPTSMMGIFGFKDMTVKAKATVAWRSSKVEVALVLDNSGSMEYNGGERMGALKPAAKSLIDILENASYSSDSVKIAVVPFGMQVRLEAGSYRNSNWLQFDSPNVSSANWAGCVGDRSRKLGLDTNLDNINTNNPDTLFWATKCRTASIGKISRLSNNFNDMRRAIDAMYGHATTNVTIGAVWGQAALSDRGPFGDGAPASNGEVRKFMVLLTDGTNTESRWNGFKEENTAMNPVTLAACASAKAKGIKVYTIRLIEGDANMLRSCASEPSMFHDVQNSAALKGVFEGIAQEIAQLRLTN